MVRMSVIRIVLLYIGIITSQVVLSAQPISESDNIANAHWTDYKDKYPKSHLCKTNEITLWTCERKQKTYSLCSSQDITEKDGYVRYRAGDGQQITFEFPATERHPKGVFEYMISGDGDALVTFRNGGYKYELYDAIRDTSSIVVWKGSNNKKISEIHCDNFNQILQLNYTIKLMRSAGVVVQE